VIGASWPWKRLLAGGFVLAVLAVVPFALGSGTAKQGAEVTGSYVLTSTGLEATLINNTSNLHFFYNAGKLADGRSVAGATFNGTPCQSTIPPGWSFDCGPYDFGPGQTAKIDVTVSGLSATNHPDLLTEYSADKATYPYMSNIPYQPPPPTGGGGGKRSTAPVCGAGEHAIAKKWKQTHGKKHLLSAKAPPSALQGQCTLPPRGPCKNQRGLDIQGGPNPDSLTGTALADTMNGQGDNDTVSGKDDNDLLRGGPGRDTLNGNQCDDVLFSSGSDHDAAWDGGPGNDVLNGSAVSMEGGPGDDYVANGFPRRGTTSGGPGDDVISVTVGEEETVSGGGGKDTIDARNRSKDTIDCGPGADTLYADQQDRFKNCEKVILS
jgi:hypothetical protein